MPRGNRREFFIVVGGGLAGLAALKWSDLASAALKEAPRGIPSHRALLVPGVHAYTDQQSVAAGEVIAFHVSSSVPYRLSVCRLGLEVDDPAADTVMHGFPAAAPRVQAIHPGSYVQVEKGLGKGLRQLTLECWVRPWKADRRAGLLTQFDEPRACGVGLFLSERGGLAFYLGDGHEFRPAQWQAAGEGRLALKRWHHVTATWDGETKTIYLNGEKIASAPWHGVVSGGTAPLRLAAAGKDGRADLFLDGDLAMPVVYERALAGDEVTERYRDGGLASVQGRGVLACWPLQEERGEAVADVSRFRRHGRIINHATWMIGGPSFEAGVPRFAPYDPQLDPHRGHGLRFASDDLYDCRWEASHRWRVPADARSGIYVGRIRYELDGKEHLYHVTFIVRKAARRRKAPILLLTATNTWRAYSGTPFGVNKAQLKQVWGTNGVTNSPGDPPAFCFYRAHAAGQGTYQLGLRLPWPAAGPHVLYGGPTDYSHLCRADRFTQAWLERCGYDYDTISDLDLHRDPEQLQGYRAFFIVGHNEYWSVPMYEGLRRYLEGGGNVVCLSGNSLFWRVSFNPEGTIIECRKVDAPGDQVPAARRGEAWHSHDGQRGGLMRECGHPGWKLIGLETLGWNNQSNPAQFGPYHVERADHFLFNEPEPCGLRNGDALGQAPDGGLPRANGHEIDVRPSTLAALQTQPAPEGASVPSDPSGLVRLANGVIPWKSGGAAFDYFFRPIKPATDQGGEMIYWERAEGGRVFNAGSIGAGWALASDRRFQCLLRNVLAHFGVR